MKRFLLGSLLLLLAAGCAPSRTAFVYRPAPPPATGKPIPLALAVFPFADGTGNHTVLGSVLTPGNCTHNLAKGGIGGRIDALTPDLWAKAFSDHLAASGGWNSVRLAYGVEELAAEDFYLEGTLLSADSGLLHLRGPNRFALALKARRRSDGRQVWEKSAAREWEIPPNFFAGCGFPEQCRTDRAHADVNRVMRDLFSELEVDLARALEPLAGGGGGGGGNGKSSATAPPGPDSVEATIDGILKAQ